MKRPVYKVFLTVSVLSLLAVSCTQQTERYSVVDEAASIRYAVKKATNAVSWTDPLEPGALEEEPAGKVRGVLFYPAAGFSLTGSMEPVYPTLENFGSLDTSLMSSAILSGVNDFLRQLSQKNLSFGSSYFDRPYEGVVILYEASQLPEITGWTVGKPFISSGDSPSFEIPVLLATAEGECSVRIYLNPEKALMDEVKIQQVMFGAVKSE